jgi:serine/threonine protein kinase
LRAKSHVGTLGYAAPEIFSGESYNEKCDIWSVGVITYILLSGVAPFVPNDVFANYAESDPFWIYVNRMVVNKHSVLQFPDRFFRDISDGAKNFVSCLLEINPSRRLRASEALHHPWLHKGKNSKTVLKSSQRTWTVADSQHVNIVSASTPTAASSGGNKDITSTQVNNNSLSPTRRFSRQPMMPSMPEEMEDD